MLHFEHQRVITLNDQGACHRVISSKVMV
jgi:hypothetical protein